MKSLRFAIVLAPLLFAFATVQADFVDIEFENPEQKKVKGGKKKSTAEILPTLQFFSGFPITIKLIMNDELGIATSDGGPPYFPKRSNTGFVVFDDPDDNLCMDSPNWINFDCLAPDDSQIPSDETYVEFTLDVDDVGLDDTVGRADRIDALVDATSGRQVITPEAGGDSSPIGASTSRLRTIYNDVGDEIGTEEIVDGYGNGADDDIPSLVLISEHGQGIVYNSDGSRPAQYEVVNLAGFVNSVGYTLNDPKVRTTITANLIVPSYLIAPVIVADECVGDIGDPSDPDLSVCESYYRVDGRDFAPATSILESGEEPISTFLNGFGELLEQTDFTVSAMVVNGVAPDTVLDLAAPFGEIDDDDLIAMGYTVLGSKKSASFNLYPGPPCFGGPSQQIGYADIDGNGISKFDDVCPAGSGSLTRPPR